MHHSCKPVCLLVLTCRSTSRSLPGPITTTSSRTQAWTRRSTATTSLQPRAWTLRASFQTSRCVIKCNRFLVVANHFCARAMLIFSTPFIPNVPKLCNLCSPPDLELSDSCKRLMLCHLNPACASSAAVAVVVIVAEWHHASVCL